MSTSNARIHAGTSVCGIGPVLRTPAASRRSPPGYLSAAGSSFVDFLGQEAAHLLPARGLPAASGAGLAPHATTIVGSEPRLAQRESEKLGISWLPRQARSELLTKIVPTFSVLAYPSRFDGLPLTLLEVMSAQIPVVVSDYGALPEVVQFGQAGMVVPGNDAKALAASLRRLRDQPAIHAELGVAARRRILDRYSASATSDGLREVYMQRVSRRSRA